MSRRGGRGSARRRRNEPRDYYTRDKYDKKNIENDEKIDNFFGAGNGGEADRWEKSLEGIEKTQIRNYTGTDFEEMNEALRKDDFESEYYTKAMVIQGALEKFNTTDDIIVHRGDSGGLIPDTWGKTFEQVSKMIKVGDEFVQPAFVSTSPNKPFEKRFFAYNIKIPKGKGRGAYIKNISQYRSAENEYLIKAGSRFKITKIKYQDGQMFVDLEMLK